MSISLDVDRVAGEAQRVVVQSMDDYYASPMFNLDVCTDFENNSVCRSRVPSECSSDLSSLDTGIETGIEAQDLNSLLDQFEEASCGFGDFPTSTAGTASVTASPQVSRPETPVTQVQPIIDRTEDVIQKIKSSTKRKSAILLPMGVPAKRGRGQALALSSCLAPRTLQKIIKSSSVDDCVVNTVGVQFVDADRITSPVQVEPPAKNIPEVVEVSEQYYNSITDHDYCQNFPKVDVDSEESTTTTVNEKNEEEEKENGQDEESEENGHFSKFQSERPKSAFFKRYEDIREKRRIYRKKQQETPAFQDDEQYYDRIPKYFSVLSKPVKRVKSSSAINIDINDSLPERDPSPERASNEKLFNKLPAYHNCFTNSSKYDINSGNQPSVQSSRSSSPLLIDSRAPSRSRSNSAHSSCSRRSASSQSSRSRSRSRSRHDRRSSGYSSRHSTRRRSRSQSRGRTRSRRGRRRRSSYSSSSRSRSYSRSRSPLSDRGRSKDRSRSRERYYKDLEKQREEEKRKQIEERRIVYVGKIPRDFTRRNLRSLFTKFGEIEETSVHFREAGDNYGFVTFGYTCDAYAAVEKGNKVPGCEHFDLCFGGRRHFCKNDYADLDGDNEIQEEFTPQSRKKTHEPNFDDLLQQAIRNAKRK